MKHMIKLPAVILGLLLLITGATQKAIAQDDDISLEVFYDELAPYGSWVQDPEYGYVWRPDVDQNNFRPYYTDGHWAMTEYGNTWVSDYEWGWAPFHYGRWILNRFHEWIWIPDTVWGPAWVSWRSGGGYYGWAPMGPGFSLDISVGGGYDTPNDWWVFIPQINIYNTSYPRYYNRNYTTIYNRTRIINYTYRGRSRNSFYTGPRADEIRRVTRRDVTVYNVSRTNRPGRTSITNNNINIYNPGPGRRGNTNTNNGRPGQPDRNISGRNTGVSNGQPVQPGRNTPGRNASNGQPDNNTPGRRNDQGQRPNTESRTGRGRVQQIPKTDGETRTDQPQIDNQARQQRYNQQRQQQDQQRQQQQREGQERQQRENQQRQQQQQQQREGQERQQRENQQRQQQDQQRQQQQQQQQQRESQERQQRENQQRQQQDQQRQQQQQQQQRENQERQQRENQQRQQQDQQRQQQQQQQRQQQEQQRQQQESRRSSEGSRVGRGQRG